MMRKIKNKLSILGLLLIMFFTVILLFDTHPVSAKNKFQWITYENKGTKIGNAVFKMKNNRIMMRKDGNTVILVKDILNDAVVSELYHIIDCNSNKENSLYLFPAYTDGKILYYSKANKGSADTTIYQMDIKTKKKKALVSGKMHTLFDIGKNHIYYGTSVYDGSRAGVDSLYSLDLKTKKKRYMTNSVGEMWIGKNKVITMVGKSEARNTEVYLFNADGTGKKKITDACNFSVENGKIYYITYNQYYKNGVFKESWKYYKCSLNGKNKKRISKKEFDKYYKW